MRKVFGYLPFLALAACGGAGAESVGTIPVPTAAAAPGGTSGGTGTGVATGTGTGGTATVTPAPTTSGGTGGTGSTPTTPATATVPVASANQPTVPGGTGTGVATGSPTNPAPTASFLNGTSAKTYSAVGSDSSLNRASNGTLYRGNASTVKTPLGTVDYDPRDGIFSVKLADTKGGVTTDLRYQDPAHRTDFNPNSMPQAGVPNLAGFNYLESVGAAAGDLSTFFYQRPGAATVYVTLAGFVRNVVPADATANQTYERAVFVFGDQTPLAQIPATGTAVYRGGFMAGMVNNTSYDRAITLSTFYQWIAGNSAVTVDFGRQTFDLSLAGVVDGAGIAQTAIQDGTAFTATGAGTIDLFRSGGFAGAFQSACFATSCSATTVNLDFASVQPGSSTAGASSIDGAFYGPNAVNVGGSFRIIGGVPDQRIDITGAFTGAKVPN